MSWALCVCRIGFSTMTGFTRRERIFLLIVGLLLLIRLLVTLIIFR